MGPYKEKCLKKCLVLCVKSILVMRSFFVCKMMICLYGMKVLNFVYKQFDDAVNSSDSSVFRLPHGITGSSSCIATFHVLVKYRRQIQYEKAECYMDYSIGT